ncbi:uncharacterized protein LOC120669255 [Panicum virgatum]|uniref:uncharacterized protein LOC120669255 n=1 Tax=Panicum virgatum TaxID=38727 RepID=UPI0019D5ABFA|nr:uncharacterized protein LOC120669255 [Panicum virgatum]
MEGMKHRVLPSARLRTSRAASAPHACQPPPAPISPTLIGDLAQRPPPYLAQASATPHGGAPSPTSAFPDRRRPRPPLPTVVGPYPFSDPRFPFPFSFLTAASPLPRRFTDPSDDSQVRGPLHSWRPAPPRQTRGTLIGSCDTLLAERLPWPRLRQAVPSAKCQVPTRLVAEGEAICRGDDFRKQVKKSASIDRAETWSRRNTSAKEGHVLVNNLKALAIFGEEAWKMSGLLENFRYGGI